MSLELHDLRAGHRDHQVFDGVDLRLERGRITALLGPNGVGKSTLLKAILGLLPSQGRITLDGQDLGALSPPERARRVAYVPQRSLLNAPLSVREVVALGRFVHGGGGRKQVDQAMERVSITALAERPFTQLSGGERQRVLLARALAVGATTLLLDEATSALDLGHALAIHRVLRELADQGHLVVSVLHDLAEAQRHADDAVLLHEGRVHAFGPVSGIVAPEPILQVYGVQMHPGQAPSWSLPGEGE